MSEMLIDDWSNLSDEADIMYEEQHSKLLALVLYLHICVQPQNEREWNCEETESEGTKCRRQFHFTTSSTKTHLILRKFDIY